MKFCPRCNTSAPDDAAFCPNCGASLNENRQAEGRCPRCGRPVAPGQVCLYCASRMNEGAASPLSTDTTPLSMWQYMGLILLAAVPLVGLIFMIIWACNSNRNIHLRNFARGALLVKAVGVVVYIILAVLFAGLFATAFHYFEQYGSIYHYNDFTQFTGALSALALRFF